MFLHSLDTFDVAALSSKITLYFHVLSDGNNNAASYAKTYEKMRINIGKAGGTSRQTALFWCLDYLQIPLPMINQNRVGRWTENCGNKGLMAEVQR